jgi:hypothetical protein
MDSDDLFASPMKKGEQPTGRPVLQKERPLDRTTRFQITAQIEIHTSSTTQIEFTIMLRTNADSCRFYLASYYDSE